ncbi:hypothetical protein QYF61_023859 [Mycteria americana]|uniref:Uncharacterized protein n=1 Tax=Mycteria americana TaxID=33587 RepID=A0AAN7NVS3_MYCAM|nr:hypothetical protein QYF61_023859 [Mycteria americana]
MVMQVVPLQHVEDHSEVDIHPAACGGPHGGAGGCVLKEAAPHREPMLEQAPGRNGGPWRGAHAGAAFLAEPVACRGPTLEQLVKNCSPLEGGPTLEQGKSCPCRFPPEINSYVIHSAIIFNSIVPYIEKEKEEVKNDSNNSRVYIRLKYNDNGDEEEEEEDKANVLRWLKRSCGDTAVQHKSHCKESEELRFGDRRFSKYYVSSCFLEGMLPQGNLLLAYCKVSLQALLRSIKSLTEDLLRQGIFQPRGVTLRGVPAQGEVLAYSPLPCRRAQRALGCPLFNVDIIPWDNGASSLELEGKEAKQLGSLSRKGDIDKAIGKGAQVLSLWR